MAWEPRPTDGSPVCEHGFGEQHLVLVAGYLTDDCPGPLPADTPVTHAQ